MKASRPRAERLLAVAEARHLVLSGQARQIRERAHLSQGEIAAAVGVAAATICRWEAGNRLLRDPDVARRYVHLLSRLHDARGTSERRTA